MTTVVETYNSNLGCTVLCDFSPPRSGDPSLIDRLADMPADFISVAYNPGRLPRADSITVAHTIQQRLGKKAIPNLAPRDMNKIALQSQLLGGTMLGMTNVVIVGGDDLTEREQQYAVKQVRDFTSTGLIAATADMNRGMDYRGANLQAPTRLCIGGAVDLGKPFESEARLAVSKVEAGAEFLITQPIYSPAERRHFLELFESVAGRPLDVPVFWGLQVLTGDGLVFGDVPTAFRRQLESGTPGTYIATQVLTQLVADGVDGVYLVPPIMRGGARDYDAAAQVLRATFG